MEDKESIDEELLSNLRSTVFNLEEEDGWIRVEKEDLISEFRDKFFDEIILSRDIIECIKDDQILISISRKEDDFYLRDERDKNNRITDFRELVESVD